MGYAKFNNMCAACHRRHCFRNNAFVPWNKGKKKETDNDVYAASLKMKEHYTSNPRKHSDETKARISESLKRVYKTKRHWTFGLTKTTSPSIQRRVDSRKSRQKKQKPKKLITEETRSKMRFRKKLSTNVVDKRLDLKNLELLGTYTDSRHQHNFLCKKCKSTFSRSAQNIFADGKCHTCFPPRCNTISAWQSEIYEFTKSLHSGTILNDRNAIFPYEIDISIPMLNFGIECNGIYWHSEFANRFDKNHAEKKRLFATKQNINIFFIFEDEWRDKQPLIKSMIKHRLGLSDKIYARKCQIERCNTRDVKKFIITSHIDGYARAKFALKLTYNNEIVGACTLRYANHGKNKATLEIARMCFKQNVCVVGGTSKFITEIAKFAKSLGVQRIITYADNRLGGYGSYLNSDFEYVGDTVPRFWWTDFHSRYDRFKFRADKQNNLSEAEVATKNNVHKIYGCSNSKFVLEI